MVLNVRIDTEEARILRLAHHVCEVQLVLGRMLDPEVIDANLGSSALYHVIMMSSITMTLELSW